MLTAFSTVQQAVRDFTDDDCLTSGAAIAYYTIFSLPPLLVIVFFVAAQFGVSEQTMDRVMRDQLGMPLGDGREFHASPAEPTGGGLVQRLGLVGRAAGIGVLIFSATGVFGQFQTALNRAWEVQADPRRTGVVQFMLKRLLSLGMIVVIAFLLLVSLVLTTMTEAVVAALIGQDPGRLGLTVGYALNAVASVLLATLLFAAMFKVLPDARMRWRDTWIGGAATAVLFVVGKALIGLYLSQADVGSAWGAAAGSIIAVLVWVYYSTVIVLFGAELTQAHLRRHGAGIEPASGAVTLRERDIRRRLHEQV